MKFLIYLYLSLQTKNNPTRVLGQNKGQLVVEYLLLLVIVVAAASLLAKTLISRSDGNPGVLINVWNNILELIGQDISD